MSGARPARDEESLRNFLIAKAIYGKYASALPWYDSIWLRSYLTAIRIIERVRPKLLPEFIEAFAALRTRPDFSATKIDRVFDDAVMQQIHATIKSLPPKMYESHEVESFGRLIVHNHAYFNDLHKTDVPLVSEIAGEAVEPSYNFLSLYTRMGVCEPHMDEPTAKWTLDICIDQSDVWPIHFSQIVPWPETQSFCDADWQAQIKRSPNLKFTSLNLRPGEAVVFSGSSQWHYRDRMQATGDADFCNLLFFHFFPAGFSKIIEPKHWAATFDLPELADIAADQP